MQQATTNYILSSSEFLNFSPNLKHMSRSSSLEELYFWSPSPEQMEELLQRIRTWVISTSLEKLPDTLGGLLEELRNMGYISLAMDPLQVINEMVDQRFIFVEGEEIIYNDDCQLFVFGSTIPLSYCQGSKESFRSLMFQRTLKWLSIQNPFPNTKHELLKSLERLPAIIIPLDTSYLLRNLISLGYVKVCEDNFHVQYFPSTREESQRSLYSGKRKMHFLAQSIMDQESCMELENDCSVNICKQQRLNSSAMRSQFCGEVVSS